MKSITVTSKNNTASELAVKEKLEKLLEHYDVSDYIYTEKVIVEDRVIPHSHPVLTVNSFPYSDKNMHLTDFLHEQLHWYFEEEQSSVDAAVKELKSKYADVPVGYPLGCRDETSTYEHLLLCRLCHNISSKILGDHHANRILYYLQNHHYVWVYATIEKDSEYIDGLLGKSNLNAVVS